MATATVLRLNDSETSEIYQINSLGVSMTNQSALSWTDSIRTETNVTYTRTNTSTGYSTREASSVD